MHCGRIKVYSGYPKLHVSRCSASIELRIPVFSKPLSEASRVWNTAGTAVGCLA
jgi:hypothetical protein